jgi:hypothetical protein
MPEVTLAKMAVGNPLRWILFNPSIRKQRIQLLADTFRSKGINMHGWQLDPIKHVMHCGIDYATQNYKYWMWGSEIHVPLDYYYQPDQEWLAESIVTEYLLKMASTLDYRVIQKKP